MKFNYRDYKWLYEHYITKKMSTIEIGRICGVSSEPIRKHLHRFDIPIRSRSEALKGYKKTNEHIRNMAAGLRELYSDPTKCTNWKGGRIFKQSGYVMILQKDHPFSDKQGYVCEHRLVAEECLERYLKPEEVVHHINEFRDDNHPENLYVFPNNQIHLAHHRSGESIKSNLPSSIKHKV